MSRLHDDEAEVLELLGEAATRFVKLHPEHPSDQQEFVQAVHAAQNIVLARVGLRSQRKRQAEGARRRAVGIVAAEERARAIKEFERRHG